jgi:phosphoribosylformylglycinamidine synthase subunit PurQ / glutaminase
MRVVVLSFPGSNCDDDAVHVARSVLGAEATKLFHKAAELPACDALILPGGFSYGDYLRSGAMAAHSPIMGAVKAYAEKGGPVLAVCNGFQIACEAGLLPGALTRNASLRFSCKDVHLAVEGKPTPFTKGIPVGRVLRMPIAHAEGRYVHPDPAALAAAGQVLFRYVDAGGARAEGSNPNGSVDDIAGICNEAGNVVGLMPHPERAAEPSLGSTDGRQLFEALRGFLAGDGRRVPTSFARAQGSR